MIMSDNYQEETYKKFFNGLFWTLLSVFFQVVVGIGTSIIFVRYLGDTGYGSVIVMADFVTMMIVCLSFGLGAMQTRVLPQLIVKKAYGESKDVIYRSYKFRIGLSIVASVMLFIILPKIQTIYIGIPTNLIKVALALVPIQMTIFCLRGTLEVTFHQKVVSIGNMTSIVFRFVFALPVIIYDLGIVWFFLTQLLSDLCLLAYFINMFSRRIIPLLKGAIRKRYKGKFYSLAFIMFLTLLSSRFLGKEVDTQILLFKLHDAGLAQVAIYSIAFMFVYRALSFVGIGQGGVSNLSQAMMSELVEEKKFEMVISIYLTQIQIYYSIVIPLIAGAFVFGEPILVMMYGKEFIGIGKICFILFSGFGISVVNYINYPVAYAFGLEKRILFGRIIFGFINLILSIVLASKGALGVASATGLCLCGIAIVESIYVKRLIFYKIPWEFILKILSGTTAMMIISIYLYKLISENITVLKLIITVIISASIYFIFLFILKPLNKKIVEKFNGLPKTFCKFAFMFAK